jgi:import inner membrane translocase subunit TIM54
LFTVVGSFSGAVIYDRRERKKAQQKWCNAVSHLSEEKLPTNALPKKLTVYLSAPPGDGLRAARDHFQEYVKPMLVAAAVDWEVVEGRKEGDLRASVAERARKNRKKQGEQSTAGVEEDVRSQVIDKSNVREEGSSGEIVIGRHTWKEYIRGIHEGWLGPVDQPSEPEFVPQSQVLVGTTIESSSQSESSPATRLESGTADDVSSTSIKGSEDENQDEAKKDEAKPKQPPSPTPPYILPNAYKTASASPYIPFEFAPSIILPLPHLLGFLNTPIRIYRFLNRRYIAEEAGRMVSTILLCSTPSLPYESPAGISNNSIITFGGNLEQPSWEQQRLLLAEEQDWHKIARKPNDEEEPDKERPWTDPMVIDSRIGSRMRKHEVISVYTTATNQRPSGADSTSQTNDGSEVKGNSREWKGGVDRPERIGWGTWLMRAVGFENNEPKCKGWEQGEVE